MERSELEQTLVLIKPDAMKNSLTGYVLSQLSEFHTGLRFAGIKVVHVTRMLADEHYAEHRGKGFFDSIIDYLRGFTHFPNDTAKQRIIALVYEGPGAISKIREFAGPTNPLVAREKKPGCIRALGTIAPIYDEAGKVIGEKMDNLIHASSSQADAEREVKLWFRPSEIPPAMQAYPTEICQEHYYFKDNQLLLNYVPGSICLLAPGEVAWKSDLDALKKIAKGEKADCSLNAIAAKYVVNESIYND